MAEPINFMHRGGLKGHDCLTRAHPRFFKGTGKFPIQKCAIFCKFKEICGIVRRRTFVRRTSDSADLSRLGVIDAEIAEKGHLWMEANSQTRR